MVKKLKTSTPQTTSQEIGSLIKSCRKMMRKDKGLTTDLDRLPMLTWIMFLKFLDDMETVHEAEASMSGKRFRHTIEAPYRWRDWAAKADGITGDALIAFIQNDETTRPDGSKGPGLFAYLRSLTGANGRDRRDVIRTVFCGVVNRMLNGYLLRDVINKVNEIHFSSTEEIYTLGHLYESMLKEMRDAAGENGEFYTPRAIVKFIVQVISPRLGETVLDPACGTGGFLAEAFEYLKKQCRTTKDHRQLQGATLFGIEAKPLPYLLCQMNLLLHGFEAPNIDPLNALRFPLREIGDKDRVDIIITNPPFGGEEERGILGNFPDDKKTTETALLFLQLIMRKLKRIPISGRAAVVVPESVMSDLGVAENIRKDLVESFNVHTIVRLPKGVFEPYSDIQTNILFFDRSEKTKGIWFYQHEVPHDRQNMRNPCYTQTFPLQYKEFETVLSWWNARKQTEKAWYIPIEKVRQQNFTFDFRNPLSKDNVSSIKPEDSIAECKKPLNKAQGLIEAIQKSFLKLHECQSPVKNISLGNFLKRVKQEVEVESNKQYSQITVKLYGKGVIQRALILGSEIKTRPQFFAGVGNLIISKIDARNGAFGIVPPELNGALITNDFPVFKIDEAVVHPRYLALMLMSNAFIAACKRSSKGTTNRKRLREELFLAEKLPIPSKDIQAIALSIADNLNELDKMLGVMSGCVQDLRLCLTDGLVPS